MRPGIAIYGTVTTRWSLVVIQPAMRNMRVLNFNLGHSYSLIVLLVTVKSSPLKRNLEKASILLKIFAAPIYSFEAAHRKSHAENFSGMSGYFEILTHTKKVHDEPVV